MSIVDELRDADRRGVCPPQNWTTRAADEIETLRNCLKFMVDNIGQPVALETRDGFEAARKLISA